MNCTIKAFGGDYLLMSDGAPVLTPIGMPIVSRYRDVAEECAGDVRRHGSDVSQQFSMYSLQVAYLGFCRTLPSDVVEAQLVERASSDLWFNRPGHPAMEVAVGRVWPAHRVRDAIEAFPQALRALSVRQRAAVLLAGVNLHSQQLALEVFSESAKARELARGACGRYVAAVAERYIGFRGQTARWTPEVWDEARCKRCSAEETVDVSDSIENCEVQYLLDLLARFGRLPEEPADRSTELTTFLREFEHRRLLSTSKDVRTASHGRSCACALHVNRATELAKLERHAEAADAWATAARTCPDSFDAWVFLAANLGLSGRLEDALAAADRAIALAPDSGIAWEKKGTLFYNVGRDDEAHACYAKAANLDKTRVVARVALARMFIDAERFDDAIRTLDEAIEVEPDRAWTHAKRALALHRKGDLRAARAAFETALELGGDREPEVVTNYGNLLADLNDSEAAVHCYTRAIQLAPGYQWAQKNLDRVRGTVAKHDKS